MISADLFQFAYIPAWYENLHELSCMATSEPWHYLQPLAETQNLNTPILERYINQVFKKQAVEYNGAKTQEDADSSFYVRNEFACFHTGLFTPRLKGIYMCFIRNKRTDTLRKWYFKGFMDENSEKLMYVHPLPLRPAHHIQEHVPSYNPEWRIRVNTNHILDDADNLSRIPESLRSAWNLPLLLETAVEITRRRAVNDWSLAVPQVFQSRVQYLLPVFLTNMERPDLAMALSVMDGYYIGHTCLTLQMAYQNARLLARPTAGWLTQLVE